MKTIFIFIGYWNYGFLISVMITTLLLFPLWLPCFLIIQLYPDFSPWIYGIAMNGIIGTFCGIDEFKRRNMKGYTGSYPDHGYGI